jgi:hypothetical protein
VAALLVLALVAFYALRERPPRMDAVAAQQAGPLRLQGWPRQLSWDDFQNLPFAPAGEPQHAAAIQSGFSVPAGGLLPSPEGDRWRYLYGTVEVRMESAHSWVAEAHRTPGVLAHEQCHLDISGLAAREWLERLRAIDAPNARQALEEAEGSYRELATKLRLVQRLYDHATRGRPGAQQEWQERIARLMRDGGNLPEPGELPGFSAIGGSEDPY